ncbi:MAG: CAAX prenyl protease-related protein [Geobacter sp.]|nr:MAG: CAAX prenyl protease-related protein [Geobacter sp.]
MHKSHSDHSALYRWLPFALFMAFIGLDEVLRFLGHKGWIHLSPRDLLYLYPVKAISVGLLLLYFRRRYEEIRPQDLAQVKNLVLSISVGVAVFLLWINMDWSFGTHGKPAGFDPTIMSDYLTRLILIISRVFGAAVIVPIMEELFWRSWLLRYIIDHDFSKIQIGTFTWSSFLISTILFGLEHNYIIAGIMAGVAYSLLLYRTKSLASCILSHAVTNFALAIYVLATSQWRFW